jgi:hypothetical protein
MKPWNAILSSLQNELDHLSQEVDGRRVLPNFLDIGLPERDFARYSSILAEVTAELGEALVTWAQKRGRRWYAGRGPTLHVELRDSPRLEMRCEYQQQQPPPPKGER